MRTCAIHCGLVFRDMPIRRRAGWRKVGNRYEQLRRDDVVIVVGARSKAYFQIIVVRRHVGAIRASAFRKLSQRDYLRKSKIPGRSIAKRNRLTHCLE